MTWRDRFDRYWFGPVSAARPWLLMKLTLLLLAFDCWTQMAGHGGRYGVGDFNVAHFALLDLVQPMPTPGIYVGSLMLSGLLAFAIAIGGHNRVALAALAIVYTWGWSMSMIDSYQHHYFLSLVLVSFAFMPRITARDLLGGEAPAAQPPAAAEKPDKKTARRGEPLTKAQRKKERRRAEAAARSRGAGVTRTGGIPRISAWSYAMVAVTCAIVYFYTAIAKMEPDWRLGHALQRITASTQALAPFEAYFGELGMESESFWWMMGTSVVLLQLLIATGYFISARRDDLADRSLATVVTLALLGALSFHLGAEYLELRIGWFSWYMIVLAVIAMLPEKLIVIVAGHLRLRFPALALSVASAAIVFIFWSTDERRLARLIVYALLALVVLAVPTRWMQWIYDAINEAAGQETSREATAILVVLAVGAGAIVAVIGKLIDLPGAFEATIVLALGSVAGIVAFAIRAQAHRARSWTLAIVASAATMWIAVSASEVRFDYYRFVGGDHRRRGEYAEALEAYVKANRYAPEGKDRKDREDQMRALLRAQGGGAAAPEGGDE